MRLIHVKNGHRWPLDACTLDHLYPVAYGYGGKRNLVAACVKCNTRKGKRLPKPHEIKNYQRIYGEPPLGSPLPRRVWVACPRNGQG